MSITAMGGRPAKRSTRLIFAGAMIVALAGCDSTGQFNPFRTDTDAGAETQASPRSVRLVDRDVEAPEVFQVTEAGLWDGRPSLGGVWVAHPDVKEPERVIIRSTRNDKFVIGALFRRERENPGPAVQVSSDAAAALDMLAGAPMELNITALRREEVPAEGEQPQADGAETLDAPEQVAQSELPPVDDESDAVSIASAALDAAEAAPQARPAARPAQAAPAPAPTAPARASTLEKPFIQIGIFSVETNARNTAQSMRTAGIVPIVKKQTSSGKTFWRVIVGPASNANERAALLKKIKAKGFEDAYAVTN